MQFKVGLAQINPILGNIQENLQIHQDYINEAKKSLVDLLIFPELSLTGYFIKDSIHNLTLKKDSSIFRYLCGLSKDLDLVISFIEEDEDNNFYVASAYLAEGEVIHIYRKIYLEYFNLKNLSQGRRLRVFDTRFGKTAILIGEDFWHYPSSYLLSLEGVGYVICQNASPTGDLTGEKIGSAEVLERLNETFAHLFGNFIFFSNRVGFENGINFWGGSEVIDPTGKRLSKASYVDEELLLVDIDDSILRNNRINNPIKSQDNIDLVLYELSKIREKLK